MTFRDNPLDPMQIIYDLQRAVKELQTQSPMDRTSITVGVFRVGGSATLRIDSSGGVVVDGRIDGAGTFRWTGTADFEGNVSISGPLTIEGDTEITGATTISGRTEITGDVDLRGNMQVRGDIEVLDDGRIRVGSMTLDPTVGNGSIVFDNGGQVFTDGDTIQVYKGNGVVQISDSEAKLQLGGRVIRITPDGIQLPFLPLIQGTGLPRGTVYLDDESFLRRASGD